MSIERLIVMANQIGDFFESYPNPEQAKEGIANHIKKFWALSMRQQIVSYVKEKDAAGLHVLVGAAIRDNESVIL